MIWDETNIMFATTAKFLSNKNFLQAVSFIITLTKTIY